MRDHARVRRPRYRPRYRPWPVPLAILQLVISLVAHAFSPLVLAGPAILLWRRNASVTVAAVCATTLLYVDLGGPLGPVVPSTLVAVVWAVTHNARIAAWASLAGLWLGWLGLAAFHLREFGSFWGEARWAGYAVLAVLFAEVVDNRRQRMSAYRKLYVEEQRRRAEQEQRRISDERLRIARELHDVLAHSLSLIAVRASVALELLESNPDEVRAALLAIKQASKGGLDEVRTVLAELRDPAPRAPAPGLERLDELIAEYPGLSVTLSQTGVKKELPAGVGLAAYRIIQEALTNVIRHSHSREAVVHLHQTPQLLLIGVADDGPALHEANEPGSGLIGIRERAAALGGVAEVGPGSSKGFTVHVGLPL
jgi:signal transduction histidine kinase